MEPPAFIVWISTVLRTLPGPTDAWADIIGHLAWPSVALILVFRFRRFLRAFLDTIADRLTRDHFKLGPFELTPNSEVVVLDPDEADESTFAYDGSDIERIEALFEFISDQAGYVTLAEWLDKNSDVELEVGDFITTPRYANMRERAFNDLVKGASG